jgi:hypothetical protein
MNIDEQIDKNQERIYQINQRINGREDRIVELEARLENDVGFNFGGLPEKYEDAYHSFIVDTVDKIPFNLHGDPAYRSITIKEWRDFLNSPAIKARYLTDVRTRREYKKIEERIEYLTQKNKDDALEIGAIMYATDILEEKKHNQRKRRAEDMLRNLNKDHFNNGNPPPPPVGQV